MLLLVSQQYSSEEGKPEVRAAGSRERNKMEKRERRKECKLSYKGIRMSVFMSKYQPILSLSLNVGLWLPRELTYLSVLLYFSLKCEQ